MNTLLFVAAVALAGLAVLLVVVAVSRRRARAAAADVVDSPLSGWLVSGEGPPVVAPDAGPALFVGYPAGSLAWLTPDGRSVFVPDAAPLPPPLPVDDPERTQPIPLPAGLGMELTFAGRSPWADDRLWPATAPYPVVVPEPGSARLFNQAVDDFASTGRLNPDETELGQTAALIVDRYRRPSIDEETISE